MHRWSDAQMDRRTDGQIGRTDSQTDRWIDRRVDAMRHIGETMPMQCRWRWGMAMGDGHGSVVQDQRLESPSTHLYRLQRNRVMFRNEAMAAVLIVLAVTATVDRPLFMGLWVSGHTVVVYPSIAPSTPNTFSISTGVPGPTNCTRPH